MMLKLTPPLTLIPSLIFGLGLGLLSAGNVQAASIATSMPVIVTVAGTCTVTASTFDFGNYFISARTMRDASNTVTAACTTGTTYNLGLDAGTGSGASTTIRKLSQGANELSYALYQDAARTVTWGNAVGSDTLTQTAGSTPIISTIYGRIFGGQNVPTGVYADTINVTLTY